MIAADTTVARLLEAHPHLVEFLATYHPHFAKLRNSLIRRVMAPRVTVADAARMAGIDAGELVRALRRAAGEPESPGGVPEPAAVPASAAAAVTPPEGLAAIPAARRVRLDVRDDIRRGEEPFAKIMSAVKQLADDEALEVRAPFEPIPLYGLLAKRGFAHWAESRAADDWSAWFYRATTVTGPLPGAGEAPPREMRTVTLDVRGLEPPLPMVRVLERLDQLAAEEQLEVIHSRRPLFLYPQLDERGFVHETDEPEPGVVRIVVRRGAA